MSSIRTSRKFGCWAVACAASVLASAGIASAQSHGVRIGKSCVSPKCRGVATDCVIEVGHDDGFGDTIAIIEAWDVVDPDGSETRVPAAGNLPIVNVEGNTTCTVGGSLPCLLCDGGVTCGGNPPISSDPGNVAFSSNTYVIQAGDPDPLEDQANIRVQDQCDAPGTSGCSGIINRIQFTAATEITDCNDGNPCTTDACLNGVCSFTPDCESAEDCSDGNVCTSDVCTAEGCCENPPLCTLDSECNDLNVCTTDSCDDGCCVNTPLCTSDAQCEDQDACTTDTCVGGCCVNTPLCTLDSECNDQDACTTDTCVDGCCRNVPLCTLDSQCNDQDDCTTDACVGGCCVNTPLCTLDSECNDQNTCTTDTCEDGCCVNTPDCTINSDCNDQDECTTDICEAGCCRNVPDCTADDDCSDDGDLCTIEFCEDSCCGRRDVVCEDDGDPCTEENCNPSTGSCESTPIEPPPPGCDFAGCTPGFWKQPHHLQYWPAPYEPEDLFNVVFGVNATGNPTLLKAVSSPGQGELVFRFHAVAALLNSAHDDVNYFYSPEEVIELVQEAYATGDFNRIKNLLAAQNELGCTVIKDGEPRGGDRSGSSKGDR